MNALGIVLFVVALLVSIMLHEAGHMLTALWSGGKVTEYFVGFGPRLWSFRRRDTEYGVKAIPAGGYVKIVGMTELEPIEPADEPYALYHKPAYKRLLTLAAGSLVHFTIALVLLLAIPLAFGIVKEDLSGTIGTVSPCVTQHAGSCDPAKDPESPAKLAGLRAGDKIVAVGSTQVHGWTGLTTALHKVKANVPVPLTYVRDGTRHTVNITPVVGNVSGDPSQVVKGTMIGIEAPLPYKDHPGVFAALGDGFHSFGQTFTGSIEGLGSIPAAIPKLFTATFDHSARSASSPVGVVGMAQVGGQIFGDHDFADFLSLIAAINMFIGIFNLLPILPLDGGHIAILLYESGRRRVSRMFGRPDPGRVDLNKMLPVAYAFLMVFVGLTVLLLAADITNPIRLPS